MGRSPYSHPATLNRDLKKKCHAIKDALKVVIIYMFYEVLWPYKPQSATATRKLHFEEKDEFLKLETNSRRSDGCVCIACITKKIFSS